MGGNVSLSLDRKICAPEETSLSYGENTKLQRAQTSLASCWCRANGHKVCVLCKSEKSNKSDGDNYYFTKQLPVELQALFPESECAAELQLIAIYFCIKTAESLFNDEKVLVYSSNDAAVGLINRTVKPKTKEQLLLKNMIAKSHGSGCCFEYLTCDAQNSPEMLFVEALCGKITSVCDRRTISKHGFEEIGVSGEPFDTIVSMIMKA